MVDYYRVVRPLGAGGMGEVYLARDVNLGRKVALKVVKQQALDVASIERLFAEARITASFNHPHIVTVYSVGYHEGRPYLALEYVQGQTLRRRLEQRPPSLGEALRLGIAIGEALCEAHDHGVLHRDLKPENMMVTTHGQLKVLDFGLAQVRRLLREAPSDSAPARRPREAPSQAAAAELDQTATLDPGMTTATLPPSAMMPGGAASVRGTGPPKAAFASAVESRASILDYLAAADDRAQGGTPAYMAPEQWQAQPCTPATDIWAFGLVLHELLGGVHPLRHLDLAQMCSAACDSKPVSLAEASEGIPAELRRMVERCLAHDPAARPSAKQIVELLEEALHPLALRPQAEECPFRGLLPYTEAHAARFFGRDSEIAAFVERIRTETILPVVGPSGAGKSSFVQAGVVPRLQEQGRWVVVSLRPGREPMESLAARIIFPIASSLPSPATSTGSTGLPDKVKGLASELETNPGLLGLKLQELATTRSSPVLLFVDQLEELYTHVSNERVRRRFMEAICRAADDPELPVRVVFTIRDDFLARLAETEEARQCLGAITLLVSPGAAALEDLLRRTVRTAGFEYEDSGLVTEMVESVSAEPAALAILQFAGAELWDARDRQRRLLLRSAFVSMGGVEGALARRAESVLHGLTGEQLEVARVLFLRLVTSEGNRRIVARTTLLDGLGAEAEGVLLRLIQGRALVVRKGPSGESDVEIVHESLAARWERLRKWIEDSREDLAFLAEVGPAAELWDRRGRRMDEVWVGEGLHDAVRKAERHGDVPAVVRAFLEAGTARADQAGRRRKRLLLAGGTGLSLLALTAVLAAILFGRKEQEASRNRDQAALQQARAEQREADTLAQQASAEIDVASGQNARAELRAALEEHDSISARAVFWKLQSTALRATFETARTAQGLSYSADGTKLAVAGTNGMVFIVNTSTGEQEAALRNTRAARSVDMLPDASELVVGYADGSVVLWSPADNRSRTLVRHGDVVNVVRFLAGGRSVASASYDESVWVTPVDETAPRVRIPARSLMAMECDASRSRLVVSTASEIKVWDAESGRELQTLVSSGSRSAVAFSPDGSQVVGAGADGRVLVWDVATGARQGEIPSDGQGIWTAAISPDGRLLAFAGESGVVQVWDRAAQALVAKIQNGGDVMAVIFSPDGSLIAAGNGEQRSVSLWSAEDAVRLGSHTPDDPAPVVAADLSADGGRLVVAKASGVVELWDAASGQFREVLSHQPEKVSVARMSPEGSQVAVGGEDGLVCLLGVGSGKPCAPLGHQRLTVMDLQFDAAGKRLASSSGDLSTCLWDVASKSLIRNLRGHEFQVNGLRFSPDGRTLLSTAHDGRILEWDTESGKALQQQWLSSAGRDVEVDARGRWLAASAFYVGTIWLWDVAHKRARTLKVCTGGGSRLRALPDPDRLLVGCVDGSAWLVEVEDGRTVRIVEGPRYAKLDLIARDAAATTLVVGAGGAVRAYELDTGRPRWRAPVLLPNPPELATQLGWLALDGQDTGVRGSAWRQHVVEQANVATMSPDGRWVWVGGYDNHLVLWAVEPDKEAFSRELAGVDAIAATNRGAAVLTREGTAHWYGVDGSERVIGQQVEAISARDGEVIVAGNDRIALLDGNAVPVASLPGRSGVTCVARVGEQLALGFQEGGVELRSDPGGSSHAVDGGLAPSSLGFEQTLSGAVVRLEPGPSGILVGGYANGGLVIWDRHTGKRLWKSYLNGSVVHLLVRDGKMYAATDVGAHQEVDLRWLTMPYCDLMREVWRESPAVWSNGKPVVRTRPSEHACAR
jgi:WD40 repeat protein/serine/threonine protein kinase